MKSLHKTVVILLLAALLCLTACSTDPPPSTDPAQGENTGTLTGTGTEATDQQTPEPEPEPAPPTAAEVYSTAKEAMEQVANLKMDINLQTQRTVSGETFDTDEVYNYEMSGLDSDAPAMHVGRYLGMDSGNQVWHLYHDSSKAYYTSQKANFSADVSFEDFAATQLPMVMLNAENYGSVEFDPADTNVILFTEATAAESWVAGEDCRLISAQGRVVLDSSAAISKAEYSVEFTLGGVTYSENYSAQYTYETPDFSQAITDLADTQFVLVSDLRIPEMIHYAYDGLFAENYSTRNSRMLTSYAAGAIYAEQSSVSICEADGEFGYTESFEAAYNYAGETGMSSYESGYKDGVHSMTIDGETTEQLGVTPLQIRNTGETILTRFFPSPEHLASLELKDAGSTWVIEFELTQARTDWLKSLIQEEMFQDADLLDGLATDYRTDFSNGYIAIEKDSLLPAGLYIDFSGTHTIEEQELELLLEINLTMTMADPMAYHKVYDELPDSEEPAAKATPLLYEVTAPDGAKMWLFGTIHIGDERTLWLPDELYSAFDAADALAVECDVQSFDERIADDSQLQQAYLQSVTYTDGTTIADHISPELYETAVVFMKGAGQFQNSEAFKPMIWSSSITGAWLDHGRTLFSEYGVDNMLLDRAQEQEKEILEVESVLFQSSMTGKFSDELQEYYLESEVSGDYRSYLDGCEELFELWCSGDEAALIEMLAAEDTSEMSLEELALYNEYNDAMIVNRNHDMTETAIEYMDSGKTVFFAVGLAHLIGEDGMVFALREVGYTVELVSYAE